jgi:ubiquinol-cytochrome c reductase cytochrome b subunit
MTRGADVYAQHCQKCHVLGGQGERDAPDHTGFGSRAWIMGLLHNPDDDHYFGKTDIDDMKPMGKLGEAKLKAAAEFLYSLGREPQDPGTIDKALAAEGEALFKDKCMNCHTYEGDGAFLLEGPDMTGYASRTWLVHQIEDAEQHYGELNDMPKFKGDLDDNDIAMVAAYLRQQRFKDVDFKVEPPAPRGGDKGEKPGE